MKRILSLKDLGISLKFKYQSATSGYESLILKTNVMDKLQAFKM